MKFVGLLNGEFKILDDVDLKVLPDLKADFSWLDVDRVDPMTREALKEAYGISEIDEFGFPTISKHKGYDIVLINYYSELSKRELQVIISKNFVITLHQGSDPVSEETMASLNEMLVSASLDSETILKNIFEAVIQKHAEHLKNSRLSLRTIELKLRDGLYNIGYLAQINKNSTEIQRVFSETKEQVSDIVIGAMELRGLSCPKGFTEIYGKLKILTSAATEFSELADEYANDMMPELWKETNRIKKMSLSFSTIAISFSTAIAIYVLLEEPFFGLAPLYLSAAIMVLGGMGAALSLSNLKFRRP